MQSSEALFLVASGNFGEERTVLYENFFIGHGRQLWGVDRASVLLPVTEALQ